MDKRKMVSRGRLARLARAHGARMARHARSGRAGQAARGWTAAQSRALARYWAAAAMRQERRHWRVDGGRVPLVFATRHQGAGRTAASGVAA